MEKISVPDGILVAQTLVDSREEQLYWYKSTYLTLAKNRRLARSLVGHLSVYNRDQEQYGQECTGIGVQGEPRRAQVMLCD